MATAYDVYYNKKQVSLITGQTRITPSRFYSTSTVGIKSYTVPDWATAFSYIVIGGGAAGQHGKSDFGGSGKGGNGGRISYGVIELDDVNRIVTARVGEGGDTNNQAGKNSWIGYGSRTIYANGGSGPSPNQAGAYEYLKLSGLEVERYLMRSDTTVRYDSGLGGYVYSTPGTGNAGHGVRGGGGAGGNGGIFGNYTKGGGGGNGYLKVVFWGIDPGMIRPATIPLSHMLYGGPTMDVVYKYETDDFDNWTSPRRGVYDRQVGRLGKHYILDEDLAVEVTREGSYNLRIGHLQETDGREVQARAKTIGYVKNGSLYVTRGNASTYEVLIELQPGDVVYPIVKLHEDATGRGSIRMLIDPTL